MNKCTCGRCPKTRIAKGLKCFNELIPSSEPRQARGRVGYSFATGVTYGRGWDLIASRAK